MEILIKVLMLALFLSVVFGRPYFPNAFLYWAVYFFMFVLVFALWFVMFWVSKRKNEKILGKKVSASFFVAKVSPVVNEDSVRGRLSFTGEEIVLVSKKKKGIVWRLNIDDVKSVSFGKVAGVRKGFILNTQTDSFSFISLKIYKYRTELYKALGWDINEKN